MTGGRWSQPPEAVAIALGRAFPAYSVRVRWDRGEPRFEAVSKDDSNLYCLISPDADEIRAVLNGA
jgi:hypothetical protein